MRKMDLEISHELTQFEKSRMLIRFCTMTCANLGRYPSCNCANASVIWRSSCPATYCIAPSPTPSRKTTIADGRLPLRCNEAYYGVKAVKHVVLDTVYTVTVQSNLTLLLFKYTITFFATMYNNYHVSVACSYL